MVQAAIRRWMARIKVGKRRWETEKSAIIIQSYYRGWHARKLAQEMRDDRNKKRRADLVQQIRRGKL